MEDYRALLRAKRMERGISQEKLADMVKVSQPFIAEIESGRKTPSVEVLLRLCEALEIPLFGRGEGEKG